MTKREAAIVSAVTGVMIGKFEDLQNYAEELLGQEIPTSYAMVCLAGKIKEKAKKDFIALHKNLI